MEEDFTDPWDSIETQEILPSFMTRTTEAGKTLDQTTEPPGQKPLVVNGIVGLFEEEEEGIGIVSDVVKVQGKALGSGHPGLFKGKHGEVARWRYILWVRAPSPDPEEAPGFPNIGWIKQSNTHAHICQYG